MASLENITSVSIKKLLTMLFITLIFTLINALNYFDHYSTVFM